VGRNPNQVLKSKVTGQEGQKIGRNRRQELDAQDRRGRGGVEKRKKKKKQKTEIIWRREKPGYIAKNQIEIPR